MNTRAILIGGIVAGLVIAMWEMVVEAVIPDGAGLFGPPIAIGATVVRDLQGMSNPIAFDAPGLVAGLAGHMMNSVILAAVFGVAVGRRELGTTALLATGMAWEPSCLAPCGSSSCRWLIRSCSTSMARRSWPVT